ncbi:hypothetical protein GGI25_003261 [Coemansia spiralis]|uniref:Kinesin-like protein n=1 Tax=Coemansia spiralis TaxID=417178 RepID=A0A9W8KXR3_9FUNG|nr:hypothetical protein GGI25_003261 [Coemansia spiralis]
MSHKIKVVCRVRPFLQKEKPDSSVTVEGKTVLRVTNPRDNTKDIRFNFDACYGARTSQETIYKNDVRPLVETIFTGLSATVFCYGVTGAGKTHTIQGSEQDPGIIPRALEHIFMHQRQDAADYDIRISYFEIYKEAVFDLLKPQDNVTLPIREDASHKIFIAGLTERKVTSFEHFDAIYQRALGNRHTASTKLNNHSSRSHAILTVRVEWADDLTKKTWCGRLHLIDLAGSEDNRRTENGRDRMAESSAINRSLFVLGQVVEALNTGSLRVPFRDSKMTRILQDSLGGESLGMMIVNVAPGTVFLQDTHNTLNFATKSREVVNKPVAHEVVEHKWTAVDRLQHHRGAARPARTVIVGTSPPKAAKRRRSHDDIDQGSAKRRADGTGAGAGAAKRHSDGVDPGAAKRPVARHSDGMPTQPLRRGGARLADAKGASQESSEIMARVLRIEKQLNTQLDSSAVIDMFTPATKLKTSRGWLKHARELEQKGDLDKALVHFEEALRYAPELNKLETHIARLRARIRRHKRRSSLQSHGEAAWQVEPAASKRDSLGPLWLADGLAESPNLEKAKRITKKVKLAARNATDGSVHDRRISFSARTPFVLDAGDLEPGDRKPVTTKLLAKSSAAARLQRRLAVPQTPGDGDFVPGSDSDESPAKPKKRRAPGAMGVRELLEQRQKREAKRSPDVKLDLAGFNEICVASALQMINSAEAKKLMKLQGIGKRRAEQIQENVRRDGPIRHIAELRDRLQFKNKLILDILSTFA